MSRIKSILFISKMGGGKDTAADFLTETYGYQKVAFADPLKGVCEKLRNQQINSAVFWMEQFFENPPLDLREKLLEFMDYPIEQGKDRKLMQDLGTNWARAHDLDVWVRALKLKLLPRELYAISDTRFLNEFYAFSNFIRIYIDASQENRRERILKRDGYYNEEAENHPAEQQIELMKPLADIIIDNNGTLDELQMQLQEVLTYASLPK